MSVTPDYLSTMFGGLRPYQQEAVRRWVALPAPRRLFLTWDMGAGKTRGALALSHFDMAERILVICPAIVRTVWQREIATLLPHISAAVIEHGSERKLSKKKAAEREAARKAPIQIVSYDLLGDIDATGWDFIIIDEFHALRSCASKQSQAVRKLLRYNSRASAVGLSGTPIPNEARQLWNPVDTLFPGRWGKQTRARYEPWAFVSRYCHMERNEYGTSFTGLREDKRAELAARFGEISHRVTQQEFAQFLPPLFVEPVQVGAKDLPRDIMRQWLHNIDGNEPHIGIYTHRRETAHAIANNLARGSMRRVFRLTGEQSPDERAQLLSEAQSCPRSCLVATTHALSEGISLSFQKAALIVEWTSDVANIVQFLGRFARQDSTSNAVTRVSIAIGPNDVSAAEKISERIDAINSVFKASRVSELTNSAFAPMEMSDASFKEQLFAAAQSLEARNALWGADEDDDDE